MAWVRPTRSRPRRPWPGQEGVAAGNSCGGGGSSLPSGGRAALGGGGQELGRDEGEQPQPTAPWPGLSIPTARCQFVEHAGIGGEAFRRGPGRDLSGNRNMLQQAPHPRAFCARLDQKQTQYASCRSLKLWTVHFWSAYGFNRRE